MAEQNSDYLKRINKLFKDGRPRPYPKHQLIHYQGDLLSHIYLIQQGYVKAYAILESGDTRTILILGPGDIFPLAFSASLDWKDYQIKYFYQSLCDIELTALPSEVLREHVEND